MGVTNYYCVDGKILGDSVSGDYMRDALGSVTGTTNPDTGAVQNTYRYKPYGERLAKTGSSPDPKFQWVGTTGYRQSSISHSASYVRARHYGEAEGRWTTVDAFWPKEQNYQYSMGNPITDIDPSGNAPCRSNTVAMVVAKLALDERRRELYACRTCIAFFCLCKVRMRIDFWFKVTVNAEPRAFRILHRLPCTMNLTDYRVHSSTKTKACEVKDMTCSLDQPPCQFNERSDLTIHKFKIGYLGSGLLEQIATVTLTGSITMKFKINVTGKECEYKDTSECIVRSRNATEL